MIGKTRKRKRSARQSLDTCDESLRKSRRLVMETNAPQVESPRAEGEKEDVCDLSQRNMLSFGSMVD